MYVRILFGTSKQKQFDVNSTLFIVNLCLVLWTACQAGGMCQVKSLVVIDQHAMILLHNPFVDGVPKYHYHVLITVDWNIYNNQLIIAFFSLPVHVINYKHAFCYVFIMSVYVYMIYREDVHIQLQADLVIRHQLILQLILLQQNHLTTLRTVAAILEVLLHLHLVRLHWTISHLFLLTTHLLRLL